MKQGKLAFGETLRADLAEERPRVSVVLLAGICRGYVGGWIHFNSIWAFQHVGDSPGRRSPAMEDARAFEKLLYLEMKPE